VWSEYHIGRASTICFCHRVSTPGRMEFRTTTTYHREDVRRTMITQGSSVPLVSVNRYLDRKVYTAWEKSALHLESAWDLSPFLMYLHPAGRDILPPAGTHTLTGCRYISDPEVLLPCDHGEVAGISFSVPDSVTICNNGQQVE
jgi:hypothetical protein